MCVRQLKIIKHSMYPCLNDWQKKNLEKEKEFRDRKRKQTKVFLPSPPFLSIPLAVSPIPNFNLSNSPGEIERIPHRKHSSRASWGATQTRWCVVYMDGSAKKKNSDRALCPKNFITSVWHGRVPTPRDCLSDDVGGYYHTYLGYPHVY